VVDSASLSLAQRLATLAVDAKAEHPVLLDMSSKNAVTDVFLVLTALNRQHVHALQQRLARTLKKDGVPTQATEGSQDARWVCMDFDTVWVHILTRDLRDYYDLEGLWGDVPRLPLAGEQASVPSSLASNG
jgi:ribosome-associated protein